MTNPYAPPAAEVDDIPIVSGNLEQASRSSRLGAAILDTAVFGVMVYVPFFVGLAAMGVSVGLDNAQRLESRQLLIIVPVALAVLGLIVWAALSIRYVLANGQSIGKKIVGIKVVRVNGAPASLPRIIFLRNGLNSVPGLIPIIGPIIGVVYGLVDALFIFRDDQRCIHDRLADTIVVQA